MFLHPSSVFFAFTFSSIFIFFPLTFSYTFFYPLSLLLQSLCFLVSFTIVFKLTILVSVVFHHSFPLYNFVPFLRLMRTFQYPYFFYLFSIALLFFTSDFIYTLPFMLIHTHSLSPSLIYHFSLFFLFFP
jgi:hypothetical protein